MVRVLALALAASAALPVSAGAVPSSFTVTGQVGAPGTVFDASALGALPQSTQPVIYISGGKPVADTFTGPTLWAVLNAAGGITGNPAIKNDVLQHYVVATGSDGYEAVISAGELNPRFGNRQDLMATGDTGNTLPSPNGFARVVATGDVAGGRYVSNLVNLDVRSGPAVAGTGGGATSGFAVTGPSVQATVSFTLTSLEALPAHTETVSYTSGSTTTTDTYTGASLWDVLNADGLALNPTIKNDMLRQVAAATGSDGYTVDFALGEFDPAFGNEPILVAYADTGGQLGTGGADGFARLVVPGDGAGGRYVSNLSSLTVFDGTTVPEPGSLTLLGGGLAVLGAARRWRGRR